MGAVKPFQLALVASLAVLVGCGTEFDLDSASSSVESAHKRRGKKGKEKITICHATHSDTNPYVEITIDKNALDAHYGTRSVGWDSLGQASCPASIIRPIPPGRAL